MAERGMLDVLAINAFSLIQMAVLALVALVLGLFVVKPILTSNARSGAAALPGPGQDDGEAAKVTQIDGATGEIELNPEVLVEGPKANPNLAMLKNAISDRETESADVLKDWLDTPMPEPEKV